MVKVLHIRLLGEFSLVYGDQPVTTVNTARLQALLAYLVLHRDAPQLRYHLAFQFWPDSSESQARTNLRHLVHLLRQTLPHADDFLDAEGATLQWRADAPWTLDVTEFESGVARGALREAVDLYRGDLLPACYDDWIMPERERLQQAYVKALERLIQQLEGAQDYGAAIEYARRLLRHDPVREATYRHLMTLCALSGDRTGVARAYDTCVTVLQRELGLEPEVETCAAYQRCLKLPAAAQRGAEFAPTPRAGARSHNLPYALTRFIGRAREMREVRQLLAEHRLVTLTGAGGIGKTRLAVAVAEDIVGAFADGVWQVDLAPLTDPALVVQAMASALGVRTEGGYPLLARLTDYLREKHLLLLLDNCEHLVEAVRLAAETWLDAAPHLQILTTSRIVLGIAGEVTWCVPPLSVPDVDLSGLRRTADAPDLTDLRQYESLQFFAERAAMALPTFAVTPQNVEVVARICQQLEGIPLALELAAARVKLLTVHQIAGRLNDPLRLLTQGSPTSPPRHQTLRATLDWSHALLTSTEQRLFRRLAVFVGGFTLEAAEFVGGGAGLESGQVLEALSGLVDKSLMSVASYSAPRFRLHEMTRQYAHARLVEAGEEEEVRDRHLDYFCSLAQATEPSLRGTEAATLVQQLAWEYPNLQAALEWSVRHQGRAQTGLRLAAALAEFWEQYNFQVEGRAWLEKLLAQAGDQAAPEVRAAALRGAGKAAYFQNDFVAARDCFEQSLTLDRALNNRPGIAEALARLGLLVSTPEDWSHARACLEESLALYRALQDRDGTALTLSFLGHMVFRQGDCVLARSMLEESLALLREAGNYVTVAVTRFSLGHIARIEGDYVQARKRYAENLKIARDVGAPWGGFFGLNAFAYLAVAERQFERAAHLLGAAEHLGETIGASLVQTERADYETSIAATRAALGEAAFAAAWVQGRAMTLDEAVAYALESPG